MSRRRKLALAAVAAGAYAGFGLRERVNVRAERDAAPALDPAALAGGRQSQVVSADGTTIHVTVHGPEDAPTVVLVHGWMCRSDFWTPQVLALGGELRLVTYDLRGHGRSRVGPHTRLDAADLADDLAAVLAATVPDGTRAVVVGHSMGAMSVVAWAGRNPEQVAEKAAAVLLASTGVAELAEAVSLFGAVGRSLLVRRTIGKLIFQVPVPYLGRSPVTLRMVRHISLSPQASLAQVAFVEDMVLACPPRVRAGWGLMMDRMDLRESVAALTVPAVLVVGTADRLTPPHLAHALADALPRAEAVHELPGVGHMCTVEAADFVNERIRELVGAHLSAPAGS
jgi:pimeloyl-ACP methyl ester carboxylesterase